MDRREFLYLSGACAVSSGCALLRGGASHRVWTAPPGVDRLEVPLSEIAALSGDEALLVEVGKQRPDLLIARRPEGYLVVTADCTHQGCTLGWSAGASEWVCPCHGSRFAIDGKVLEGPAEDPLQTPPARVEGEKLVIELAGLA